MKENSFPSCMSCATLFFYFIERYKNMFASVQDARNKAKTWLLKFIQIRQNRLISLLYCFEEENYLRSCFHICIFAFECTDHYSRNKNHVATSRRGVRLLHWYQADQVTNANMLITSDHWSISKSLHLWGQLPLSRHLFSLYLLFVQVKSV